MTEHDERDHDEQRPKVRVVDKRRYREGEAEETPSVGTPDAASGAPRPSPGPAADADELARARAEAA